MRVLIVNTSEATGGAAIAARRLAVALRQEGVEAEMLVARDDATWAHTSVAGSALARRGAFLWERLRIFAANGWSRRGLWLVDIAAAGVDIVETEAFQRADIVHLHWTNQGFLSLRGLEAVVRSGKPVVWTLHDMWPATAICHHAGDCGRYAERCRDCPQLLRPRDNDLSAQVFDAKRRIYHEAPITFVAVSQWMAERARRSALVKGHNVEVIPNALPVDDFRRMDKAEARRVLALPADARIVAFGAARIDLPAKGLRRLMQALSLLVDEGRGQGLHLLLFGACKDEAIFDEMPCDCTHLGSISGHAELARVYSAADALVCASDYETFGQTLVEAMACGCVPVSFDRGGQTDIIRHLVDGYLAPFGDIRALARGIEWALASPLEPERLRNSARERFDSHVVARSHIRLYESLLRRE